MEKISAPGPRGHRRDRHSKERGSPTKGSGPRPSKEGGILRAARNSKEVGVLSRVTRASKEGSALSRGARVSSEGVLSRAARASKEAILSRAGRLSKEGGLLRAPASLTAVSVSSSEVHPSGEGEPSPAPSEALSDGSASNQKRWLADQVKDAEMQDVAAAPPSPPKPAAAAEKREKRRRTSVPAIVVSSMTPTPSQAEAVPSSARRDARKSHDGSLGSGSPRGKQRRSSLASIVPPTLGLSEAKNAGEAVNGPSDAALSAVADSEAEERFISVKGFESMLHFMMKNAFNEEECACLSGRAGGQRAMPAPSPPP